MEVSERAVALKTIAEFEFGYVVMRNDNEARQGGYARFFNRRPSRKSLMGDDGLARPVCIGVLAMGITVG